MIVAVPSKGRAGGVKTQKVIPSCRVYAPRLEVDGVGEGLRKEARAAQRRVNRTARRSDERSERQIVRPSGEGQSDPGFQGWEIGQIERRHAALAKTGSRQTRSAADAGQRAPAAALAERGGRGQRAPVAVLAESGGRG